MSAPLRRLAAAIGRRLGQPGSLARRALAAGIWQAGDQVFTQAVRLGGNLILTRLLAPEHFGVMAMALTIQTGLMMATDIGLNLSVIRSRHGEDPLFLRTAWTIKLQKHALVALGLVAAGMALAALAAAVDLGDTVYADPVLGLVIAAMAGQVLLRGVESLNLAIGERRLTMRRNVIVNITAHAAGLAAMVAVALQQPTVWALVLGGIVTAGGRCALSHLIVPGPRMGFAMDPAYRREIWGFGRWLIGASVFSFLSRQGDRLILGALLDPLAFSLYAIARIWIDASSIAVQKVSEPVIRGVLGEVGRDRPKALAGALTKARIVQAVVSIAAFAFFVFGGQRLIEALYPPAYAAVGPLLAVLSPILLTKLFSPFGVLLLNAGESREHARTTMMRCALLFVLAPAAFLLLGERWAYLTIALNGALGVPRQIMLSARIVPLSMPREIALYALVVAAAVAASLTAGASQVE